MTHMGAFKNIGPFFVGVPRIRTTMVWGCIGEFLLCDLCRKVCRWMRILQGFM